MPPVKTTGSVLGKYSAKIAQSVANHADDPTTYGRIELPGGITNGVAQLVEAKFDLYKSGDNTGEPYLQLRGVVIEPSEVMTRNGTVQVRGLQTMVMVPVCETKSSRGKVTTFDEAIANVLNEFRKLGVDTAGGVDLEETAAALREAKPYFRFSTSQKAPTTQDPDPRVWQNWHGNKGLEDYAPPEDGGGVEDETQEEPPAKKPTQTTAAKATPNGKPTTPATGKTSTLSKKTPPPPPVEDETPEETDWSESDDLDTLCQAAQEDDKGAQERLNVIATEAGVSQEDFDAAGTYHEIPALIEAAQSGGEGEGEEEEEQEEAAPPEKGDVRKYIPVDKKTGKPGKKAFECEVKLVNAKTQTVMLKNLEKPTEVYNNIPWSELLPEG